MIFLFFKTIIKEMGRANFSFAILLVGIAQLYEMHRNQKYRSVKLFKNSSEVINVNVDMSNFNDYTDNLEEYVNKQGATLGQEADILQRILDAITTCYQYGVVNKKTYKKMHIKFEKYFADALHILQ